MHTNAPLSVAENNSQYAVLTLYMHTRLTGVFYGSVYLDS